VLGQTGKAKRFFAPLFIDLDRRRAGRERTWRHLTVAEDRQIVPSDTAVGYRIQSGREQWMAYRSLGPPGNRTVLGQNRTTEFFVVRLLPRDRVETIVDVESQEDDRAT
jgi:hypothetical protein